MKIHFNDNELNLCGPLTLSELLSQQGVSLMGTAVAMNNHVVHRQLWATTKLYDGDRVSVFTVVAGG